MGDKHQRKISSKLRDENNVALAAVRLWEDVPGLTTEAGPTAVEQQSVSVEDGGGITESIDEESDGEMHAASKKSKWKADVDGKKAKKAPPTKRTKLHHVPEVVGTDDEVEEVQERKSEETAEAELRKFVAFGNQTLYSCITKRMLDEGLERTNLRLF